MAGSLSSKRGILTRSIARHYEIHPSAFASSHFPNGLSAFNAISQPSLIRKFSHSRRAPRNPARSVATVPSRRCGSENAEKTPRHCPPLRRNFGEIYEAVRTGRLSPVADNFILSAADFPDPAVTGAGNRGQTRGTRAFSVIRLPSLLPPSIPRRSLRLGRCRESV